MRATVIGLVAALAVLGSCAVSMLWPGGGADEVSTESGMTPSERAMARVRAEIEKAQPGEAYTNWEQDALAWVYATRGEDWEYAAIEAKALGLWVAAEGIGDTPRWAMDWSEHAIDSMRSLDVDGDGRLSEAEIADFAVFWETMLDPLAHPYMIERFDADGDGELSDDESPFLASYGWASRMRAMEQRVSTDLWDADNDGLVSEQEAEAGRAQALRHAMVFADGHIEYVAVPDDAAQAVELEQLAALGEDVVAFTQARQADVAGLYLATELDQVVTLIDLATEFDAEPAPSPPLAEMLRTWGPEDFAAWELADQSRQARNIARQMAATYDAQIGRADRDNDGRILDDEWEGYLYELVDERDQALFLRHYDLDGNGSFGSAELETYVDWYRAGSVRADANYDGRVDVGDLRVVAERFEAE